MNSFTSPQIPTALPFPQKNIGKPLAADLYSRIFDAILEQRIHAASRFSEESLAQMFSVRRSEVRDVLTRLSHQQIVILRTHHRPRIIAIDAEQTRQTLHARRLTETTLVRLACQRSRQQDLKHMRGLIDQQRQCLELDQRGAAIRLSGDFHLQLADMAGNAPLAHFLGSLVPQISLAVAQLEVEAEDYCVWQVHLEILDSVERGDAVTAQMLLSRHLDHLEESLLNPKPTFRHNRVAG